MPSKENAFIPYMNVSKWIDHKNGCDLAREIHQKKLSFWVLWPTIGGLPKVGELGKLFFNLRIIILPRKSKKLSKKIAYGKFKTRNRQKPIWLNIVYFDFSVDQLPFSRKTI